MADYTYPGVYVKEIPPQIRPIAGVGTSTAAFVGVAEKGVINKPKKLFSFREFNTEFGDFLPQIFLAHAVFHFFNSGGRECYVIRLAPDCWKFVNSRGEECLRVEAKPSTQKRKLTVEAEISTIDSNLFTLKVSPTHVDTSPADDSALELIDEESFKNLSMSPSSLDYVGLVTDKSKLIKVVVPELNGDAGYTKGKAAVSYPIPKSEKKRKFKIQIDDSASRVVTISDADDIDNAQKFNAVLKKALNDAGFSDQIFEISVKGDPVTITITSRTSGNNSQVIVSSYTKDSAENAAEMLGLVGVDVVQHHGASANRPNATVAATPANPGRQVPSRVEGQATAPSATDYVRALKLLDRVDDVNLIAIPGVGDADVVDAATSYCRDRQLGDCFFIADMRADVTSLASAQEWRNGVTGGVLGVNASDYGAAYFPWLRMEDPTSNTPGALPVEVPPSGFVAGIYARTDEARGVWKAPAGVEATVSGTLGLVTELTDPEQGDLNVGNKAIDVIRRFPSVGIVVWGSRTLAMESDPNRYIPVRRTAIFLKRSIYNGIQWAVFEPNGEQLWASLRASVGEFMNGLYRAHAFQGSRASEAYFVACGKGRTMEQNDIDSGKVIVEVGFAPLKPAEFVIVRIQQTVRQ